MKTFFSKVHGIIIVYDVTNKKSFENIKNWLLEIENNSYKGVNLILAGNKCDLTAKKLVNYDEAKVILKLE
jgi:Ras-related protein Rab-1A